MKTPELTSIPEKELKQNERLDSRRLSFWKEIAEKFVASERLNNEDERKIALWEMLAEKTV